jgi:hypothetical protein
MGRKKNETTDLTTPTNIRKGQAVYDRMISGKSKDVTAELHKTYGTKPKRG